ncbi:MAG: alkaline phosphatase D family protein [Phycisphaeraceae bacterium]
MTSTRNSILAAVMIALTLLIVPALQGCQRTPGHVPGPEVRTIAFASCAKADQPQQIWQSILDAEPDLFLFIGDNVYVDIPRPPAGAEDFERTYAEFEQRQPGWRALRREVPVLATWDDHDYGLNDAGKEFALKRVAQQQFIDFFDLPEDSPVRQRQGVYDAHLFGPEGRRLQVILLDTRSFRDALVRNPQGRVDGKGPYVPRTDGRSTLLGEAQWAWLQAQLERPADVRVIASSIQVIADEHGWETWGNFPHERQRLFDLIEKTGAAGVFFISGDRHLTEASRDAGPATPYPMWDFTSSGMNERNRPVREPNTHRTGPVLRTANFGLLRIDWRRDDPAITFESRGRDGRVLFAERVLLTEVR